VLLSLDAVTVSGTDSGLTPAKALLQDISWSVQPGERWVVLGSNGAGKTTLLRVCAGELPVHRGAAFALGDDLADGPVEGVGLMSPAVRLSPDVHSRDAVTSAAYGGFPGPYDPADLLRAEQLLLQVGAREIVHRPWGLLSEGERQRVLLARALMTDPEVLLLDEPAAGLDLGAREALLRMLARLASDPTAPALVLVTHHVEEIPPGFTHALLLRRGQVVSAGPLTEALTAPALSRCFGLPLIVQSGAGRFSARAA
jgi:iron complex transport system ATP-binding protein